MIKIDGVMYCNAAEAARYLGINRCMFYSNVKHQLISYKVGVRKRMMYKVEDLDLFRNVEPLVLAVDFMSA